MDHDGDLLQKFVSGHRNLRKPIGTIAKYYDNPMTFRLQKYKISRKMAEGGMGYREKIVTATAAYDI